jgi:hypothetical protein
VSLTEGRPCHRPPEKKWTDGKTLELDLTDLQHRRRLVAPARLQC